MDTFSRAVVILGYDSKIQMNIYYVVVSSGVPRNFVREGGSTNSVEDRENGDLGAVAPHSGFLESAVIWYKKFHFIQ